LHKKIPIEKINPGSFFKFNNTIVLKTDYRTDNGICICYIIGSGDYFCGGVSESQRNGLLVTPIWSSLEEV